LNRAAKRLLDLTGETVLPMAPNVSKAVQKHFPAFRNEYSSLPVQLTAAHLPGGERAQSLVRQLAQILDRDASDAPLSLGAEESAIVENLAWARSVRKALEDGLGKDAEEGAALTKNIGSLPKIGSLEDLTNATATVRTELQDLLGREDFFTSAAQIRSCLTDLKAQVSTAAGQLRGEIETHFTAQREGVTAMDEWAALPESDRAELSAQMDGPGLPQAGDFESITGLLNRRMEIDGTLARVRGAVNERYRAVKEQEPTPPSSGGARVREGVVRTVRLRRNYTKADQPALEKAVTDLSAGLTLLKSDPDSEITIDLA
jgi:hypothetical protein